MNCGGMLDYLQQFFASVFGYGDYDQASPKKVVAFGNGLLDHTVFLEDSSIFKKYDIQEGGTGLLPREVLDALINEVCDESNQFIKSPGGSILNSVRVLKALGTDATYFGSIGGDKNGFELEKLLSEDGIDARLEKIESESTGTCVCLIYNNSTAKYASIGAAEKFSFDFLNNSKSFLRPVDRKQILFMEGFFVPQHAELMDFIVKNYIHGRRLLALTLSAPYIIQECFPEIMYLCNNAFFIIGNLSEFTILAEKMGVPTIEAAARQIMQHGAVVKVIIVTKGAHGADLITNYCDENSKPGNIMFQSFNVGKIEKVVDDTGAGDAFAAAFFHAWLEKRQLSECIRFASDIAGKVVTQIGCNLPKE